MKKILFSVLFLTLGIVHSQSNCSQYGSNYIPKDLNDAVTYLDCNWTDSDKNEFKSKAEKEAVTELHFGTGMSIRNGWELWKGKNQLYKYFKSKGITHPDDISSIVLTSFHRKLNNKPMDLESQVKYYQDFWKKSRKEYELMEKEQDELNKKKFDSFEVLDSVKIAFKLNRQGKNVWIYNLYQEPDFNQGPDCYVKGIIKRKKERSKRRGNHVLTILITDICGNNEAIYNGIDERLKVNNEYNFFRVGSFDIIKE